MVYATKTEILCTYGLKKRGVYGGAGSRDLTTLSLSPRISSLIFLFSVFLRSLSPCQHNRRLNNTQQARKNDNRAYKQRKNSVQWQPSRPSASQREQILKYDKRITLTLPSVVQYCSWRIPRCHSAKVTIKHSLNNRNC